MDQEKKFIKDLLGFYQNQLLAGYYRKRGKSLIIPNIVFCLERLARLDSKKINILDIGCGKGNLLKIVSALVSNLGLKNRIQLSGLDFDEDLINQAKQEDGHGITYYHRDLRFHLMEDLYKKYDLVLCINTLHEIFSSYFQDNNLIGSNKIKIAKNKTVTVIEQIGKMISDSGSIVFYDGVNLPAKEEKRIFKFKIKSKVLAHNFQRFIDEYNIGKLNYKKTGQIYQMTGGNLIKLIGTFKYLNTKLWPIESDETYFYMNQNELVNAFEKNGLNIEYKAVISNDLGLWKHNIELINVEEFPDKSILLVASKKYLYSEFDHFC